MHAAQLVLRAKTSTVFTIITPKSTKFFLLQKKVYEDLKKNNMLFLTTTKLHRLSGFISS